MPDGTEEETRVPGVDYHIFSLVAGGPDGSGGVKPPGTVLLESDSKAATSRGFEFAVALSFPGEKREFVEEVDRALQRFLKPENVFYDRRFEHRLARIDLLPYLQSIYHDRSELVVVFLCADYERKDWCRMEWRALLDIIKKRRGSSIMPFRFDDCEIPGFYSTDGYVDVGTRTPDAVAELISKRLSHNRQERDSPDATG